MTKDKRTWILARHLEANKLGWSLYYSNLAFAKKQRACVYNIPTYEKTLSERLQKMLKPLGDMDHGKERFKT